MPETSCHISVAESTPALFSKHRKRRAILGVLSTCRAAMLRCVRANQRWRTHLSKNSLLAIASMALALAVPVQFAEAVESATKPTRVKIATLSHHENGCSESPHPFVIDIPDAERLDLDYKGSLAGIEIREVEANNGHSFGNVAFLDGQNKMTITLWAKGTGHRVDNPLKIFGGGNGSVCVGAEGASEGVEIWAHYKSS
jgi:hypothetical protein